MKNWYILCEPLCKQTLQDGQFIKPLQTNIQSTYSPPAPCKLTSSNSTGETEQPWFPDN